MEYFGTRQLGGFSHAGQILAPATRPWITDLAALCPYEGLQPGNLPEFERDPDWTNWALTDSPKDSSERLNWHVFQDVGTRLLIADRMLMSRVSWQDLDEAGYVYGTEIKIDGKPFRCRLLTGGDTPCDDPYQGATAPNEWDALVGGGGASNAPQPDPANSAAPLSPDHLNAPHNALWNWFGAVSWTAEPVASRTDGRACRGYHGPTYFYINTVNHRHEDIGWRPVLEEVL
ncbi:hypothetical protein CLV88_13312 [Shimia abyssi]|uniref:Uncharacterized protein n=2 Tax=Shimia abyssi TaxID=1662395 RepID=A0A2P8EVJ5_9RHOB|nr:hypothetical protein CLV88_13312 [Shimia abyssi]